MKCGNFLMSNFKVTDNFLRGIMKLEYKEPKVFVPVVLTFESQQELDMFWDGIEYVSQVMHQEELKCKDYAWTPFRMQLIAISNLFSELT